MKMRFKRPKGLTFQIKTLKNIRNEIEYKKEKDRIISRIINEYIQEGFRLNNKPITLLQLSEFIGESLIQIMRRMNRLGEALLGDQNNAYKALMANTIGALLVTKAHTVQQYEALRLSQGAEYQPFISSAVNEALRGLISTDVNLINMLKVMAPSTHQGQTGTRIEINNNPLTNNLQQNNLLNVNDAIKLIDKQRDTPLLENQNKIDDLASIYIEEGTPQILATKQRGSNTDGIVRPKKKIKVHELRREDQGEIINPEIITPD